MIYLDIETLDFFQDEHIKALPRDQQLAAMRFGCAVTAQIDPYAPNDHDPKWYAWTGSQVYDLCDTLRLQIARQRAIVGWNIIDFDLPVIRFNAERAGKLGDVPPATWINDAPVVDLFALIRNATGRWYSLEIVAQHNLGRGKLADGQRAAEWLRSGDPALTAKAFQYCRYDVQLTIDLHSVLLRGDPLRLPPRLARQELNEVLFWLDGRIEWLPDELGNLSTR